jgi:hypothetical protein
MTSHASLLAAPSWHPPADGHSTTLTRQSALDIIVPADARGRPAHAAQRERRPAAGEQSADGGDVMSSSTSA